MAQTLPWEKLLELPEVTQDVDVTGLRVVPPDKALNDSWVFYVKML
jgi:hypothetical protein